MEQNHVKYQRLLDFCKTLPPTPTAVAHPCDESSLRGAVDAAKLGLIAPILVGPRSRIEAIAKQFGIDITGLPIVDSEHSHASAEKAVALVREGKAEALMKGSLHTDELMGAVVKRDTGLRTARRVSHCFVMDVPSYAETLIVTDAAVNIAPTMEDIRAEIVMNDSEFDRNVTIKNQKIKAELRYRNSRSSTLSEKNSTALLVKYYQDSNVLVSFPAEMNINLLNIFPANDRGGFSLVKENTSPSKELNLKFFDFEQNNIETVWNLILNDMKYSSDFAGVLANGKWQLRVQDRLKGDIATFKSAVLELSATEPIVTP